MHQRSTDTPSRQVTVVIESAHKAGAKVGLCASAQRSSRIRSISRRLRHRFHFRESRQLSGSEAQGR
jgi:hypothetical protein